MTNTSNNYLPISVVMSCYNSERWLHESIESILKQTLADFEFIIVDDGSQDRTPEILREFAKRDNRISVVTKLNTGLADSLNVGISRARGMWIARIDADDLSEPERLEKQLSFANSNFDLVFIGSGLVEIDENGKEGKVHTYPKNHYQLLKSLTTSRKFVAHSSAFFNVDAFRKVGGYRPRIRRAEDRDLWLRLSRVGGIGCIQQPLVKIRKHSAQISHDEGGIRQRVDATVSTVSYWLRHFGQADPLDQDLDNFEKYYTWVEYQIANSGFNEVTAYRSKLKTFVKCGTLQAWAGLLITISLHPILTYHVVRIRLFGTNFALDLARVWMKNS